jgi:hypothetical protein
MWSLDNKEQMKEMQTLFVADKKLCELECLFACDISDDDGFYDVLAYNITQIEPSYFIDPDSTVKQNAIDELGELGDVSAIDEIRRFLPDPDEDVRLAAATAINALGRRHKKAPLSHRRERSDREVALS